MRKSTTWIVVLLALTLLLTACSGALDATSAEASQLSSTAPAQQSGSEATAEPAPATTTEADEAARRPESWDDAIGTGKVGCLLPDFTVTTAEGETFTLSEALKDHELVLINLWATWCGPCNSEFPFLEQAYAAYQDRVAVIALSTEATDTAEVLREFAAKKQLTFPLAQDEDYRLTKCFKLEAIPTSVLVDRNGMVVWTEVGAMSSAEDFKKAFDRFLSQMPGAAYGEVTYRVRVLDQNNDPVPGAVVNFCSDESCLPVPANENGESLFTAELAAYHIQLLSLPDGYEAEEDVQAAIGPWSGSWTFRVVKQG